MLYVLIVLAVIAAIIGMVRYKKLTMPFRLLSLYFIFEIIITISDKWEIVKYGINAPVVHTDILGTYIFFALIYYYLFKNRYVKVFIMASIVLVAIFSIINAFFLQPYNTEFPTYVMLPTEVLYVTFAVLLFNNMLLYPSQINIIKQSIFWFNTAVLIYNSSLFLNSALVNYYKDHHLGNVYIISYFWYVSIIIFDILLTVAILTDNKEISSANAQLSYKNRE